MKTFRTGKSSNRKGTAVKKKEANEGGAKNRVLTRAMHVRLMISLGVIVLGLIGLMIKVYAIQSNSKNYNQKVILLFCLLWRNTKATMYKSPIPM